MNYVPVSDVCVPLPAAMDNEVKQRNRRRKRAQRMQAQRQEKEKGAVGAGGKGRDRHPGDSGEDESPVREKPPRPPTRRKKSREPLVEEDIVDGFAILGFKSYEDLEVGCFFVLPAVASAPGVYARATVTAVTFALASLSTLAFSSHLI